MFELNNCQKNSVTVIAETFRVRRHTSFFLNILKNKNKKEYIKKDWLH